MTLVELGVLFGKGATRLVGDGAEILRVLESDPGFRILPITVEIAREVRALVQVLRDPADCVIAATARVHGLRLVTSDQRIIAANVVSMVE